MKEIKLAMIGCGMRGKNILKDAILPLKMATVFALCDVRAEHLSEAADMVEKDTGVRPVEYTDYMDAINNEEVNTVIVSTGWEAHNEIAIAAMKAGKAVGLEVGGAYDIQPCWDLVNTYEETKTPFMFLENCCYGKRELMGLNMARKGFFGTIVHCAGSYRHDLRDSLYQNSINGRYRLKNYLNRNGDTYPTHDLGPIAMVLNLNRGNRMLTMSSFASKACGVRDYVARKYPENEKMKNVQLKHGDIVHTMIQCSNGETILLSLDTTLPTYYSRNFTIRGTYASYEEMTDSIYEDTPECYEDRHGWARKRSGSADNFETEYQHPIWKKFIEKNVTDGHGGMDYLIFGDFFRCLLEDKPMPIDVYDAASWMAITALSEQSILHGGAPMDIPDFTRGKWHLRKNEFAIEE